MSLLHITAEFSPRRVGGGGKGYVFFLADHALFVIGHCNWDAEDMCLLFQVEDKTLQNSLQAALKV